jgi:hypothetical protein
MRQGVGLDGVHGESCGKGAKRAKRSEFTTKNTKIESSRHNGTKIGRRQSIPNSFVFLGALVVPIIPVSSRAAPP